MGINKLYQYITTFKLINITIKNIAIRLWRRPVLGQSEIVCTVAILDVQGNTDARWRAGERSRSGGERLVAQRTLTLLNAPLMARLI